VNLFLENGSTFETKDNFRRTPLSWAASNGNYAIVKLLLNENANERIKRVTHRCCWHGDLGMRSPSFSSLLRLHSHHSGNTRLCIAALGRSSGT
jgi:ankyrin repeat protein